MIGAMIAHPITGVTRHAEHAVAATQRERLDRRGFFPDLDPVGDERETTAGASGHGGDGQLGQVAADDAAGSGTGGPRLAHEGGLGARACGAGERFAVELRPREVGRAGEVVVGVVEGDESERPIRGVLRKGAQVEPQDALDAAIGGGELGREEGGFHAGFRGNGELGTSGRMTTRL